MPPVRWGLRPASARDASPGRTAAILALALGGFGIGTTEFVAMGLLPSVAAAFDISEPTAGHTVTAYALGVVVGAPVIAAAAARVQRRTLLLWLMVAFTLGNLATVLAPSYPALIAARFVAGLPHGAYFGVAAIVAAHLAPEGKRATYVGNVMLGLAVANVAGVPAATWLGDLFGWRTAFAVVVGIGLATVVALARNLPDLSGIPESNPMTELGALRRSQVWFVLLIGIVGFGGMFAFYTYIRTTLTDVSGLSDAVIPIALALYGVGMVLGNIIGGRAADGVGPAAIPVGLASMALALTAFVVLAESPWAALALMVVVGAAGASLVAPLQTRLMDVADDAQTLAASLNHSALNVANALGALLGGVVIDLGWGRLAPSGLGIGLAVAGIGVFWLARLDARRSVGRTGDSVAAAAADRSTDLVGAVR